MPLSISDVVSSRVRKYRRAKGWTVKDLAERCTPSSPTLTEASITNLERRPGAVRARRTITLEELFTLAVVLEVQPVALLLPIGEDEEIEIAGQVVSVAQAFRWLTSAMSAGLDGVNPQDMSSWYAIAYLRSAIEAQALSDSAGYLNAARENPREDIAAEQARQAAEAAHWRELSERAAGGDSPSGGVQSDG